LRPLIEFATETAMRRSELLRLRWSDINYDSSLAKLEVTKNGEGRDIPLSPRALHILASLPRDGERIFPITDNSVRLAWSRLVKRAALADYHFHDLRHEAISRFFEQGLSIPEVALISGHKTPSMLFRYTHLKAVAIVDKLHKL
jgi:integrase